MGKQSEVIARLLSVILERLWPFEDVTNCEKMENRSTVMKSKGKNSDNYRPVCSALALNKAMEQTTDLLFVGTQSTPNRLTCYLLCLS